MKQATEIREFERYFEDIMKQYNIPGFAMGLAEDGELCYEKKSGLRDSEDKLPLSSDTVFGVGSITKAVTAVAILQLQENGKLNVNDPVINYLPEFKTHNKVQSQKITIHHFLTHSSGIPPLPTLMGAVKESMESDPDFKIDPQQGNPLDAIQTINSHSDLMDAIATAKFTLLGEPGTEFSYSNDGYALLGAIIERVSGMSYEQYVQENIFTPAGMHHSVFQYEDLKEYEDIAVLYDTRKNGDEEIVFRSNHPWGAPAMRAAGFIKSTVNDMLKFMEVIRNEGKVGSARILSTESVKVMTTPYMQCSHDTYYGYGVMIIPDFFGYKLIHHGGDIKGVTAQMGILPELGLTGISLANLAEAPSSKLLFSAFAGYVGKPSDASHLDVEMVDIPHESLKEFEGTFMANDGMTSTFYLENDELYVTIPGFATKILKPIGEDQFLGSMRDQDTTIRFRRNKDKTIHRVEVAFRQLLKVEETT
ncbi:penicillin-binding protein E [Oceanobacillus picturae]|uniref:Penicillin-binding protein E n=1 Tax=Oceanobacillus picturae TaxID=171693 RepID=A0A0U9H429_9BACI|nr:serine hydrolase domain-containing protein [Oceanobacillus picturae]GAQ16457.1 penicillin-binding protein E [Oceanobacillus picturae]